MRGRCCWCAHAHAHPNEGCRPRSLQPPTPQYAALHSWIVTCIAAEVHLELFELLHCDTEPPAAPAATEPPAAATDHRDDHHHHDHHNSHKHDEYRGGYLSHGQYRDYHHPATSRASYTSDREPPDPTVQYWESLWVLKIVVP